MGAAKLIVVRSIAYPQNGHFIVFGGRDWVRGGEPPGAGSAGENPWVGGGIAGGAVGGESGGGDGTVADGGTLATGGAAGRTRGGTGATKGGAETLGSGEAAEPLGESATPGGARSIGRADPRARNAIASSRNT